MRRVLTDQVIIITGASSGIGAATSIECAKAGMNVLLNARREEKLHAVAEQVRHAGAEAEVVVGDVTDQRISARMLDAAQQRFGRFDVVFANAGYGLEKPAVEVSQEQLRHIFEVNFFAATDLLNEAAQRLLAEHRPGHLLMCSSCLAKFTLPLYSAYSATKAAQSHLCRAMRIELEPHSIDVSSVYPITTATEFFEVAQRLSGREAGRASVPDHARRGFVQSPQRVARAIVRCLRRPKPEVWTSHTVRTVAAVMTMFPSFMDVVMRRAAKNH
ncbi:MAG: SDR family NAD(P)-dependent oxidoreductase [Planctomycetes bacterium]|nr:SDR family NAD(P)-dependent oxidoreductase [Planctomycetota bacterium]